MQNGDRIMKKNELKNRSASQRGAANRRLGANGEREIVNRFREVGYTEEQIYRTQQYAGRFRSHNVPDVQGPGLSIESKRFAERVDWLGAYRQSQESATPGDIPITVLRKNHTEPIVMISLDEFLTIFKVYCPPGGVNDEN